MVPWKGETNYIDIYHTGGCGSWLGMTGGQQTLYLGGGCANTVGTPIHEVMHAIGTNASYSFSLTICKIKRWLMTFMVCFSILTEKLHCMTIFSR